MRFMIVLFLAAVCWAAEWQPIGPWGGLVSKLGMAPSNNDIIYGVSENYPKRVYKTTNGGDSWTYMSTLHPIAFTMAVDPTNPDIVYAGGDDADFSTGRYVDTVFKSIDGGITWVGHSIAHDSAFIHDIAVHPNSSSIVFAGGYLRKPDLQRYMYVFKSTDSGINWERKELGPDDGDVFCLAISPSHPHIIYAGGYYEDSGDSPAVFKSTDEGENFTEVSSGLLDSDWVISAAVHPTNPDYVYVIMYWGHIYRTTDGGSSWSKVFSDTENWLYHVVTTAGDPNVVYASGGACIYKSTDCGASWFETADNPIGGGYYGLVVDQTDANIVYSTNYSAVSKTSNGGVDWFYSSNGINNRMLEGVGISPSSSNIVYTSSVHGYKTYNGCTDWVVLPQYGICLGHFAVHNTNSDIVFGVSNGPTGG